MVTKDRLDAFYRESSGAIADVVEIMTRRGKELHEFIVVAADVTHPDMFTLMTHLNGAPLVPEGGGLVLASDEATVEHCLRAAGIDPRARMSVPIPEGRIRVLVALDGLARFFDIRVPRQATKYPIGHA